MQRSMRSPDSGVDEGPVVDGEGGVGEVVEQSWLCGLCYGGLYELDAWGGVCGWGRVRDGRVAGGHLSSRRRLPQGANPGRRQVMSPRG